MGRRVFEKIKSCVSCLLDKGVFFIYPDKVSWDIAASELSLSLSICPFFHFSVGFLTYQASFHCLESGDLYQADLDVRIG